ncbi:MAG: hypothetical protein ACHQK8_05915 [Bacteroidia bacterium]
MNQKTGTIDLIFFITVSFLLSVFVFLKSYLIPFTWDEIYTYEHYVKKGFFLFEKYSYMDANNHLLNTWLMEVCLKILGSNETLLRLPNLFALPFFLFFAAKLVLNFSSRVMRYFSFFILVLNPYLLDYFSVARGYGLSMALLMAAFYYSYQFIEKKGSWTNAFYSVLFSNLALLANSTLAYFVAINSFLITILAIMRFRKSEEYLNEKFFEMVKNIFILLLPNLILIFAAHYLNQLKNAGALYWGGTVGFWTDTVSSLIEETVYNKPAILVFANLITWFIIFILIVSALVFSIEFIRKKKGEYLVFAFYIFMLLLLCGLATYCSHLFLGVKFPLERSALFYIPMFSLLIIFLLNYSFREFRRISIISIVSLGTVFSANFLNSMTLHSVIQYTMHREAKKMIADLDALKKHPPSGKYNLSLGCDPAYVYEMNGYRYNYHLTWLNKVEWDDVYHPMHDYYFIHKNELSVLGKIPVKILDEYPESGMVLVSNEEKWKTNEFIYQSVNNKSANDSSYSFRLSTDSLNRFSGFFSFTVDSSLLKNKNTIVVLKAEVCSAHLDNDAFLVILVKNNREAYQWKTVPVKDFLIKENERAEAYLTCPVSQKIRPGDGIEAYLWNTGKYKVNINRMEWKVVGFEK